MRYLISIMLIMVGVIHLLPLSGVLGPERLSILYGIAFDDPTMIMLMRHRAVLFGVLGVFFIFAAFHPDFQPLAFIIGFVSVISFLWLASPANQYTVEISRVVIADYIALACLVAGATAYLYIRQRV
jgi:hypothetical protein